MRTVRASVLVAMAAVSAVVGSGHAASASPAASASGPLSSPSPIAQPATTTFATPEDAIHAYLAGVADADVEGILRASAIDELSAGFDLARYADRYRALLVATTLAPSGYPFYVELNRARQTERILGEVQLLAYSLLSSQTIDETSIPVDKAWADTFSAEVDPARLAGLTVTDIRFPNARFEHDPKYLSGAAAQAAVYGADELTERLALVSLDGHLYQVGFTLLRYGAGWKVYQQSSSLAGMGGLGTAVPTTVEDFDRLTAGD